MVCPSPGSAPPLHGLLVHNALGCLAYNNMLHLLYASSNVPGHRTAQIMERPGIQCPPHMEVRGDRGMHRIALEDFPDPVAYCDAMLKIDQSSVPVLQIRGDVLLRQGRTWSRRCPNHTAVRSSCPGHQLMQHGLRPIRHPDQAALHRPLIDPKHCTRSMRFSSGSRRIRRYRRSESLYKCRLIQIYQEVAGPKGFEPPT